MKTRPKYNVCDACGSSLANASVRDVLTTQVLRGEELAVFAPVTICQNCNFQSLGEGQFDELRKRTADAYRTKHGFLTSEEIVERRKTLGLTQEQFADRLGVGVASVKRWETWLVQDKSMDQLIRGKTDKDRLVNLIARALYNAEETPITAHAYHQIVEGETKIQEGVVQLLKHLTATYTQWCSLLTANVFAEQPARWTEIKLNSKPLSISRQCSLLSESVGTGSTRLQGSYTITVPVTIPVRTRLQRITFQDERDVVSFAA